MGENRKTPWATKQWLRAAWVTTMFILPTPLFAQSLSDTLSGLEELGFDPTYLFIAAGLGILLILFYLFAIIFRRIQKGKQPDMMSGLTYLDVTGMGKQGLLTPEEQAKVRQAMSRQIARQKQTNTQANLPGELALLADPEVQRLEELAEAKKRGENPPAALREEPTGNETTDTIPPTADFPETLDPIPRDWKGPAETDDVEVPADVLALAKRGLITQEELEVIKERIRSRK